MLARVAARVVRLVVLLLAAAMPLPAEDFSRRRPAVVGAARPEGFRLGGVVVWRLAPRRSSPCFSWRRRLGVVLCGLFDFFHGLLYLFFISSMGFGGGVVARAYPTQASMPKTAATATNAVS